MVTLRRVITDLSPGTSTQKPDARGHNEQTVKQAICVPIVIAPASHVEPSCKRTSVVSGDGELRHVGQVRNRHRGGPLRASIISHLHIQIQIKYQQQQHSSTQQPVHSASTPVFQKVAGARRGGGQHDAISRDKNQSQTHEYELKATKIRTCPCPL